MNTKIIKTSVEKLVADELALSYEKFPAFNSPHEGYAVILEEVEEARDELLTLIEVTDAIWKQVKENRVIRITVESAKEYATNLACEAVQAAAMCQKYIDSLLGGTDL